MTARITSRQTDRIKQHAADAIRGLTKDGAQRLIKRGDVFQTRLKELALQLSTDYYTPHFDNEAVAWIVEYAKKPEAEAWQIVEGFRCNARMAGVADTVKIHAEVQPGCTVKRDIPQMGPCWEDFKYLQGWNFPDQPTEHALVSWISAPLPESTEKNMSEQAAVIASFKTEVGLPAWYDVSFGSVNHIGGMSLAHFNATGMDPFNSLVVRTDTCYADGGRLGLRWRRGRLCCVDWYWGGGRRSVLAVFVVGVVKALGR